MTLRELKMYADKNGFYLGDVVRRGRQKGCRYICWSESGKNFHLIIKPGTPLLKIKDWIEQNARLDIANEQ